MTGYFADRWRISGRLVATGETFTLGPAAGRCPECDQPVVTGVDRGRPYRVDPWPITVLAEIAIRKTSSRMTWEVTTGVYIRDVKRIRPGVPVVADHDGTGPKDIAGQYVAALSAFLSTVDTRDDRCLVMLADLFGATVLS